MGCLTKLVSGFVVFLAIIVGAIFYLSQIPDTPPDPELLNDRYWGKKLWSPGDPIPKDDESIRPFKISVTNEEIDDLKWRLQRTRIQESLPDVKMHYGFHSNVLKKVVDYWLTKYDWKKQEKMLNSYPHFKTTIEGLEVHFIHVKSKKENALPLMMVHGWPGSFVEFTKIVPLLDDFDLVIPSIPGYGFSEASHKAGLNGFHIARIFAKLMNRLKYVKFMYHAGDWGAIIGRSLARMYPENVIGLHTTMPIGPFTPLSLLKIASCRFGLEKYMFEDHVGEARRYADIVTGGLSALLEESGYLHIQATKPDTIGVALNNDPAGLAAYILEKFSTGTNRDNRNKADGGLNEVFTMDELLNNVMIYWITQTSTSAARLYKEGIGASFQDRGKVNVPTAALTARTEVPTILSKTLMKDVYNVVKYTDLDKHGHFLAYEAPKVVSDDIRDFAKRLVIS